MTAVAPERVSNTAISPATAFNWLGGSCRSKATTRFMFGLRILASLMSRRTGAMAQYPLRQAHHVSYSVELTANRPPDIKTARFSI